MLKNRFREISWAGRRLNLRQHILASKFKTVRGVSERTIGTRLRQAGERLRVELDAPFSLGPRAAFPSDKGETYAED